MARKLLNSAIVLSLVFCLPMADSWGRGFGGGGRGGFGGGGFGGAVAVASVVAASAARVAVASVVAASAAPVVVAALAGTRSAEAGAVASVVVAVNVVVLEEAPRVDSAATEQELVGPDWARVRAVSAEDSAELGSAALVPRDLVVAARVVEVSVDRAPARWSRWIWAGRTRRVWRTRFIWWCRLRRSWR